jgi:hypothetical protein
MFTSTMELKRPADLDPDLMAQIRRNFLGKASPVLSPVEEEDKENQAKAQHGQALAPMIEGFPESDSRIRFIARTKHG